MSSLYSIDQMKWLSDRLEEDGYTPELVSRFGQDGNLRAFKKVLEGRADVVSRGILRSLGVKTITLTERHDPDEFYLEHQDLGVWGDFHSLIEANARPSEKDATFKVEHFELLENSTDDEIEGSLPENHFFGETELCAVIAGLIAEQSNGEEGVLLNDGRDNFFYTKSCVVNIIRNSKYHMWDIDTWLRDDDDEDRVGDVVGNKVFSPAT